MDTIRRELLHAWVRSHRGVCDERVADAMQGALDVGLTSGEVYAVMDEAARITEHVRERRYRTGRPPYAVRGGVV